MVGGFLKQGAGGFLKEGQPSIDPKYSNPYHREAPKNPIILGNRQTGVNQKADLPQGPPSCLQTSVAGYILGIV